MNGSPTCISVCIGLTSWDLSDEDIFAIAVSSIVVADKCGITILIIAHFRSREKGFECGDLIFEFAIKLRKINLVLHVSSVKQHSV